MTAFAVSSVLAGVVYGSRRWPGTLRAHTLVLVLTMAAAFALPGLTAQPWYFTAAFAIGGLLYSPLMIIRNLVLQERLPQRGWATGFSVLYAAAGLGYGVAGLLAAGLLHTVGSGTAFLVCALGATVIGVVAIASERAHRTPSVTVDAPPVVERAGSPG
jgi:MFS family permease